MLRWIRNFLVILLVLLSGPAVMLVGGEVLGKEWWEAERGSARMAPDPATTHEAVVQVYAARAWGWRGAFGVHTWIAVKPTGANAYTVYHVLGWRHYRGGRSVVIQQDVPDRHWFGNQPELLADLRGDGVDVVIGKIDAAAQSYPHANTYTIYPGPNSNTFTAWIARKVPELRLDLPPTAIGKDYLGDSLAAATPSGTGYQISLWGLLGITAATEEGFEINIAGLTFGIDPKDLGLKLPGIGRIGPAPDPTRNPTSRDFY